MFMAFFRFLKIAHNSKYKPENGHLTYSFLYELPFEIAERPQEWQSPPRLIRPLQLLCVQLQDPPPPQKGLFWGEWTSQCKVMKNNTTSCFAPPQQGTQNHGSRKKQGHFFSFFFGPCPSISVRHMTSQVSKFKTWLHGHWLFGQQT